MYSDYFIVIKLHALVRTSLNSTIVFSIVDFLVSLLLVLERTQILWLLLYLMMRMKAVDDHVLLLRRTLSLEANQEGHKDKRHKLQRQYDRARYDKQDHDVIEQKVNLFATALVIAATHATQSRRVIAKVSGIVVATAAPEHANVIHGIACAIRGVLRLKWQHNVLLNKGLSRSLDVATLRHEHAEQHQVTQEEHAYDDLVQHEATLAQAADANEAEQAHQDGKAGDHEQRQREAVQRAHVVVSFTQAKQVPANHGGARE